MFVLHPFNNPNSSWKIDVSRLFSLRKHKLSRSSWEFGKSGMFVLSRVNSAYTFQKSEEFGMQRLSCLTLLEGLTYLDCSYCNGIAELNLQVSLTHLLCTDCTMLEGLSLPSNLETLNCTSCPKLTSLPSTLKNLLRENNIGLTNLSLPEGLTHLVCRRCEGLKGINLPKAL